jgi:hypothetical protein
MSNMMTCNLGRYKQLLRYYFREEDDILSRFKLPIQVHKWNSYSLKISAQADIRYASFWNFLKFLIRVCPKLHLKPKNYNSLPLTQTALCNIDVIASALIKADDRE